MTRAFVALRPSPPVLDALEVLSVRAQREIRPARWTQREQWHLTLQFLGDRVQVGRVVGALQTLELAGGTLQLGGIGAFPKERRATVLWVGVARGAEWVTTLAQEVAARLATIDHQPDDRPFHPHVTLARMEPPQDVRSPVANLAAETVGETWTPAEVVLYASHPGRGGPTYEPLATFPLG